MVHEDAEIHPCEELYKEVQEVQGLVTELSATASPSGTLPRPRSRISRRTSSLSPTASIERRDPLIGPFPPPPISPGLSTNKKLSPDLSLPSSTTSSSAESDKESSEEEEGSEGSKTDCHDLIPYLGFCTHQRCPPRLWLQLGSVLQWCMFNVIMILVNNEIFQRYGFTFPLTLTAIHFVVSFVGAYVVIEILHMRPKAEVEGVALLRWVLPMAAVSCFNFVLGQLSVHYVPLQTLLVTKALSPGLTVAIQTLALGTEFHYWVYASLLPVMGGMLLTYMADVQLDPFMLFSALGCVVLGCATIVCTEVLLHGTSFNLDSINALYQMVPYSALILAPPAIVMEGSQVYAWFNSLLDPLPAMTAILISGFFAFCLNFSLFYTIQNTSALTFTVASNLKMAVSLVFSHVLFQAPLTQLSALGIAIEVLGVGFYGWALFQIRKYHLALSRTDSQLMHVKEQYKEEGIDVYLGAML